MELSTFLVQILNGLQYGMLLFLIASGLTLTFGVMGILNLAHGAFFMLGAYVAFHLIRYSGWSFPAAYAGAIAVVVLLGALIERSVLAPLAKRDHLDQVLVTFGLILIFDELAVILWGKDVQPAEIPPPLQGSIQLSSMMVYPVYRLVIAAIGVGAAVALYLMVAKTRLGLRLFDRSEPSRMRLSGRAEGRLGFGEGEAIVTLAATADGRTRLGYRYVAAIGGKLAGFGQRMLDGVVRVLLADFFERLGSHLRGDRTGVGLMAPLRRWRAMLQLLLRRQ